MRLPAGKAGEGLEEALEEVARTEDRNASKNMEHEEISITGNDTVDTTRNRALQEHIVFDVPAAL